MSGEIDGDRLADLDELIAGLNHVAADHACDLGDLASVEAARLFGLAQACRLLAPFWSGHRTLGAVLKTAPSGVAANARFLLEQHGWLSEDD